ncbi:hypothetical protein EC988_009542, partial [Linderina pennispora]
REVTEPFLLDAGMEEGELDALFEKLSIDAPAPTKREPEPAITTRVLPKAQRLKDMLDTSSTGSSAAEQTIVPSLAKNTTMAAAATTARPKSPKKEQQKEQARPIAMPPIQAYSQQSRFHNETVVTLSKDVDLRDVNLTIGDVDMLVDSRLWFKAGYHYGFIGRNGVGKSTLLNAIGNKTLIGFPENIRTLYVQQLDVLETNTTVLEAVLAADVERQKRVNDVQALEAGVADPVTLKTALDKYIA